MDSSGKAVRTKPFICGVCEGKVVDMINSMTFASRFANDGHSKKYLGTLEDDECPFSLNLFRIPEEHNNPWAIL